MNTNIISIKYEDDFCPRTFNGREYSYYTNKILNIGDLVEAPTKYGTKIAKVTRINVPENEIINIKPYMKTITRKIEIDTSIFMRFRKMQHNERKANCKSFSTKIA